MGAPLASQKQLGFKMLCDGLAAVSLVGPAKDLKRVLQNLVHSQCTHACNDTHCNCIVAPLSSYHHSIIQVHACRLAMQSTTQLPAA